MSRSMAHVSDFDVPLAADENARPSCGWCAAPIAMSIVGATPLGNCPAHEDDARDLSYARERFASGRRGNASTQHLRTVVLLAHDAEVPMSTLGAGTVRIGPDGTKYEYTRRGWAIRSIPPAAIDEVEAVTP